MSLHLFSWQNHQHCLQQPSFWWFMQVWQQNCGPGIKLHGPSVCIFETVLCPLVLFCHFILVWSLWFFSFLPVSILSLWLLLFSFAFFRSFPFFLSSVFPHPLFPFVHWSRISFSCIHYFFLSPPSITLFLCLSPWFLFWSFPHYNLLIFNSIIPFAHVKSFYVLMEPWGGIPRWLQWPFDDQWVAGLSLTPLALKCLWVR